VVASGSRAAVIDPSTDIDHYIEIAARDGATITHIFDTHLHADHISGGRMLRERTGAQLVLNPSDPFHYDYTPLEDGTTVELNDGVHLSVASGAWAHGRFHGLSLGQRCLIYW
jgi:glyoxylase-like metal-dependent hydrolase (beta-lactamase superfamily II)